MNLGETGFPYAFSEPSTETIGGKSFDTIETSIEYEGFSINQKYYSILLDNYVLSFIATYFSEDDLNEINDMLANAKFE